MKYIIRLFIVLNCISCVDENKHTITEESPNRTQKYIEAELLSFLDSIGHIDPDIWVDSVRFTVDSVLQNQIQLNNQLSPKDLAVVMASKNTGKLDFAVAERIFPSLKNYENIGSKMVDNELLIRFYPFANGGANFDEFAILIGDPNGMSWSNEVYFFKGNTIIARHDVFHRYGIEIEHFKNKEGETVIYYNVNYGSGTGIWWNAYHFYKYQGNKIIPLLTELKNINLQFPWSIRSYHIDSEILSKNPLKMKFVYENQFVGAEQIVDFVRDSAIAVYVYNAEMKKYEPQFQKTGYNKYKQLSYYIEDNELLFVNAFYRELKADLDSNDNEKRDAVYLYLNELYQLSNKISQ